MKYRIQHNNKQQKKIILIKAHFTTAMKSQIIIRSKRTNYNVEINDSDNNHEIRIQTQRHQYLEQL